MLTYTSRFPDGHEKAPDREQGQGIGIPTL